MTERTERGRRGEKDGDGRARADCLPTLGQPLCPFSVFSVLSVLSVLSAVPAHCPGGRMRPRSPVRGRRCESAIAARRRARRRRGGGDTRRRRLGGRASAWPTWSAGLRRAPPAASASAASPRRSPWRRALTLVDDGPVRPRPAARALPAGLPARRHGYHGPADRGAPERPERRVRRRALLLHRALPRSRQRLPLDPLGVPDVPARHAHRVRHGPVHHPGPGPGTWRTADRTPS